jgi:hypothetical protein
VINHIETSCGICALESPTIIFEDNAACVAQMQTGSIKTNYEGPREATGGGGGEREPNQILLQELAYV